MKKYAKEFIAAALILLCFILKQLCYIWPFSDFGLFCRYTWPLIEFFPLLITVLVTVNKYITPTNIAKVLAVVAPIQFVDLFLYIIGGIPYLVFQPFLPIIKLFMVFLAVKWVCKCKIKPQKTFLILMAVFYGLYILEYGQLRYAEYLKMKYITFNNYDFVSYLDILTRNEAASSDILELCYYAVLIIGIIGISLLIPAPAKKQGEDEREEVLQIEGKWRCLGCGEFVSDDKDRCECGYKR